MKLVSYRTKRQQRERPSELTLRYLLQHRKPPSYSHNGPRDETARNAAGRSDEEQLPKRHPACFIAAGSGSGGLSRLWHERDDKSRICEWVTHAVRPSSPRKCQGPALTIRELSIAAVLCCCCLCLGCIPYVRDILPAQIDISYVLRGVSTL
jgi:hypothetical protein